MTLASRLRFWRRNEPPRQEVPLVGNTSVRIRHILRRDYPGTHIGPDGHYEYRLPKLPRGALARIADEVGCSRAYAGQVAREAGYQKVASR